jgi:hypothetical protein
MEYHMTISNAADRKKILDALTEISNSMTRISAERDFIKDAVADVSDKFQIQRKIVAKMARVYHKQSFNTESEENSEFESLYEEVVVIPAPK